MEDENFNLPDSLDLNAKLGDLSYDDLKLIAAAVAGHERWRGVSKKKRKAHAQMMVNSRKKMTKEQLVERARKGGLARAAKAKLMAQAE